MYPVIPVHFNDGDGALENLVAFQTREHDLGQYRTNCGTRLACILFRHIALKILALRQQSFRFFVQSDEKSNYAIRTPQLCGIALKSKTDEQTCKPGSVVEGGHLSTPSVAERLSPSVGELRRAGVCPLSMLLRIGFTGPHGLPCAGELLPRLSTLTCRSRRYISVALSLRSPSAAVSRYPALRSPDFPHACRNMPAIAQSAHQLYIVPKKYGYVKYDLK